MVLIMRVLSSLLALTLGLVLSSASAAAVDALPYGTLSWTRESPAPTALGLARRAQAYVFIDMSANKTVRDLYESFRQFFGITYKQNYGLQVILVCNDGYPLSKSGSQDEYWAKATDPQSILLHSLLGADAVSGLVLVDKSGAIVLVERFNQDSFKNKGRACATQRTLMEALGRASEPLLDDTSQFPAACAQALGLIRMGDIPDALLSAATVGRDGKDLLMDLHQQTDRIIVADTELMEDATQPAGRRMRAELRLADELPECSSPRLRSTSNTALHKAAHDRSLQAEQAAWMQLEAYCMAMNRVKARDVVAIQRDLLPQITAKYPTTYAADVVKLIRKACRLN
jgi:hypothetical protein